MKNIGLIEKMTNGTTRRLQEHINEEYISSVISMKKRKEMNLSKEECIDVITYSLQAIYGEVIKLIIVLTIAGVCGFFLEAVMTTLGFSLLRGVAGGVHMETFERCLIATSVIILGMAYISTIYNVGLIVLSILIVVSFILVKVYAPLGSEEKPLDTQEEQEKYNKKSILYVLVFGIISVIINILGYSNISLALISGVIIECFTITPVGVSAFAKFENVLRKVVN